MKRKLLTTLTGIAMAGSILAPTFTMAQSTTTTTQINSITTLIQQIQALQSQINALKTSQTTLGVQVATEFNAFLTDLSLGSRGDAVLALQALLAANPNIYPEGLITGFFGKATERALKRLQKENGIEQVGRVGTKTRALLNRLLNNHPVAFENDNGDNATSTSRGQGRRLCAKVPPGHLIAPGWLRKHGGERPIVSECQRLPEGIQKKIEDGFRFGSTTPDTIAPVVRDLLATSTSSTTASITWLTNENATSTLWYSTTTPVDATTTTKLDNNTWKKNHSYNLSGLVASTTYYYLIKATDMAGNSVTSVEHSFMTVGN